MQIGDGETYLEKRTLGTCRSLSTSEFQISSYALNITQIHEQILYPLRSATAHSNKLSSLVVRICQSGHILILQSKFRQLVNYSSELRKDEIQRVSHLDQVPVVGKRMLLPNE
jgi:hypothetical protein